MLDREEAISYEAWKLHRLTTHPDLSIEAYNTEMGALAAAWDEAIAHLVAAGAINSEAASLAEAANPHRQVGMRGHTPHAGSHLPAPRPAIAHINAAGAVPVSAETDPNEN